jgi:tRNA pseudouridine13 synthase
MQIKAVPEDFIVKEVIDLKTNSGDYSYYTLKKRNYTTIKAVSFIAEKLGINVKNIGFAGMKDKNAVTEQAVSIFRGPKKDFKFNDIELKFIGIGKERINLGENKGNYFEIVVRNIEKAPKTKKFIINCFDEQRFSKNNAEIGKAIVKGDFKDACDLLENEKEAADHLKTNPGDYVGALRKINKRILRLFIHAYQAYIWNKAAEEYLKKNKASKIKIPIVGFGAELEGEIGEIINKILKDEKISQRDFIIRQIPEISSEGNERDLIAEISGLEIGKLEADELNKGKKKVKLKFFLQKGSYATAVIKQLFQAS